MGNLWARVRIYGRLGAGRQDLLGQTMIELTLPYPISANSYWRIYQPKGFKHPLMIVSSEAKKYKKEVARICRQGGIESPLPGRICLDIQLFPHRPQDWIKRAQANPFAWDDDVRCLDLDNANKVLLDSLKGIAIEDDKWVRKIVSERMEPDGGARVVVRIRKIEPIASRVIPELALEFAKPPAAKREIEVKPF